MLTLTGDDPPPTMDRIKQRRSLDVGSLYRVRGTHPVCLTGNRIRDGPFLARPGNCVCAYDGDRWTVHAYTCDLIAAPPPGAHLIATFSNGMTADGATAKQGRDQEIKRPNGSAFSFAKVTVEGAKSDRQLHSGKVILLGKEVKL
ncbi:hypothetical protein TTRE_0000318301 [Trichuris trichiura]|uniref:Uncharacterized protein n=1 Tax=Trichuris trichiura TaxID=36087 RepID=A0A077Z5H6_TRITR|nr:hypothetical protein TTRE_0000318301 [Trichuris trichiura]